MNIIVDPEFEHIVPPLSEAEFNQLEENIVQDGKVYEPLVLWGDIIVDGHNRWHIIRKHPSIPYSTIQKDFASRDEAIEWMCKKQLGRRNLNGYQRSMLLGEIYSARIRTEGRDTTGKFTSSQTTEQPRDEFGHFIRGQQNASRGLTSTIVAKEQGVTSAAIERATQFYKGMKKIESVSPETASKILSGELTPSKQDVASIRNMGDDETASAIQQISKGQKVRPEYKPTKCATQMEHTHEYDINDFREELRGKVVNLDQSLDMTCRLVHAAMLETPEGKDALSDALLDIVGIVQKYKALC